MRAHMHHNGEPITSAFMRALNVPAAYLVARQTGCPSSERVGPQYVGGTAHTRCRPSSRQPIQAAYSKRVQEASANRDDKGKRVPIVSAFAKGEHPRRPHEARGSRRLQHTLKRAESGERGRAADGRLKRTEPGQRIKTVEARQQRTQ
eukprot:1142152-Pelagomonas_calceolata.AAC.5